MSRQRFYIELSEEAKDVLCSMEGHEDNAVFRRLLHDEVDKAKKEMETLCQRQKRMMESSTVDKVEEHKKALLSVDIPEANDLTEDDIRAAIAFMKARKKT